MDAASCRRWSLAFVAYRWRHLFWILPLSGLLTGAGVEWRKYQKSLQPSGVVEAVPLTGSLPALFAGTYPSLGFAEIRAIALSDEVLGAAALHADMTRDGTSLEDCIRKLRPMVEVSPGAGSNSAVISVAGKRSPRSEELTVAVIRKTVWYVDKTAYAERSTRLKKEKAELDALKKSINPAQAMISITVREDPWRDSRKLDKADAVRRISAPATDEFARQRAEAEQRSAESIRRLGEMIMAEKFHRGSAAPLAVTRSPSVKPPVPTAWERVQQVTPTVALGVGSGIFAAVALAYLLQALLPGRGKRLVGMVA
jgi:hypothetical protein